MDLNSITAICAVIIALASLVVTLMEARAGRGHNRQGEREQISRGLPEANALDAGIRVTDDLGTQIAAEI